MTEENREKFVAVRKRIIEKDFIRLNPEQRRAVMATEGPVLLLAGAGSGKTTVLINRISNLLRYGRASDCNDVPDNITDGDLRFLQEYSLHPTDEGRARAVSLCAVEPAEPWRVIAITFTNKAANEIKARLEAQIGPQAGDVWASTFHSACVRILRRDISRLGYDSSFTIYDTTDGQTLVKNIIKDMNLDDKLFPPKTVLNYISRAKDSYQDADEFSAYWSKSGNVRMIKISQIYSEYSSRMKQGNALDFDDLVMLTVRLLDENEDVRSYYQRKFKYVLVDEYQDTNNLQYRLTALLAGERANVCVVGDDDQSIYRFRGATIENILNFESQYKNARVIRLEQNYRSTGNILNAANSVIANNTERKGKELWTNSGSGEPITVYQCRNEDDEANYVAGQILAAYSQGANWRDFAVLYRMNAQSNRLEYAFARLGIPVHIIGGMRFFDRAEIKDILSYLWIINNPTDNVRLLRIVNNPPRGIGAKTLDTCSEIAHTEGRPVFEIMKECVNYPELVKSAPKLRLFVELIDELRKLAGEMQLPDFYEKVLDATGYIRMLEAKDSIENQTRIENVRELKTNILSYMKNNPDGTLFGFLDEISLYTDIQQYNDDDNYTVMMTIHSAKGLEFDNVFLVGAEEGIFPSSRSMEPSELEEERRLCYVAMTRAKKKLYITNAYMRTLFGKTSANQESRFIGEIPDEYIRRGTNMRTDAYDYGYAPQHRTRETSRPAQTSAASTQFKPKPVNQTSGAKFSIPSVQKAPVKYQIGADIMHSSFGAGVVQDYRLSGNDAIVEIMFEKVGKKCFMVNSAAKYIKVL